MKNEKITSRSEDFAAWYTDVVKAARLADYSSVKGCIIFEPNGYAIWESMQAKMDKMFKKSGHTNVYMPVFIPENLLKKEGELVEGFAPEVAWITHGGSNLLEERLAFRPTSESLFCDYYKNTVKTYRDLPKLYNQWCSVVRWEKTTRPFLRGSEFLWQEGHTVHATESEAKEETLRMLNIYKDTCKDLMAIPMVTGIKTDKEKFAGAEETYTIEALMHDGKVLQSGTSHYFGQGFAKAFNMKFLDKDNKEKFVYQTSWGVSTRLIGAVIMVHGDDNGLVLPPKMAPIQVEIIPIKMQDEKVMELANTLHEKLTKAGIRCEVDDSDKSPGFKFNEAEVKGIPLRIEFGPRDLENNQIIVAKRNDYTKQTIELNSNIEEVISKLLDQIQDEMYNKALEHLKDNTHETKDYNELKEILDSKGGFVKVPWCKELDCELKIKEDINATSRCIVGENTKDKCICCGKDSKCDVYFAKSY